MFKPLTLLLLAFFISIQARGAAVSENDFVAHLKTQRGRMEAEKTKEGRIRVFREFKNYVMAQKAAPDEALFHTLTRLAEYARLVNEGSLDTAGCAASRAHIVFEAHPRGEPAENFISGEAKEVLWYLTRLCE